MSSVAAFLAHPEILTFRTTSYSSYSSRVRGRNQYILLLSSLGDFPSRWRGKETLPPLWVGKNLCGARVGFIQDLQRAALTPVARDKDIADRQIGRGPEIEVSRVPLMPVALLLNRALIDGAGVAHQEHPPFIQGV